MNKGHLCLAGDEADGGGVRRKLLLRWEGEKRCVGESPKHHLQEDRYE